jgi:tetratricopeptide (TPR) repeat protein
MAFQSRVLAMLACLLPFAAPAAEIKLAKFTAYEAPNYTIITARPEKRVRKLMTDIAQFERALELALGRKATPTGVPTHIFIASRREWQKFLQPREGLVGWFQPQRFANYLVIDGDSDPDSTLQTVFHEYTHYFLRSQFSGEYPPWFNEGLAEVMGQATFKNGMATFNVPLGRVFDVRDGQWIPFDRLIRIDNASPEYISHKLAPVFYGQAWLTVNYGFLVDRAFGKRMLEYMQLLNRLVPVEDAARTAFGEDLGVVDGQLREYSRRSQMYAGQLKVEDAPAIVMSPGRPLSDVEALIAVADIMLVTNAPPDRIRTVIDAAETKAPGSTSVEILKLRHALWTEDSVEFDRLKKALPEQLPEDDWQTRKALALTLVKRLYEAGPLSNIKGSELDADANQAMELLERVLGQQTDDVEALWAYGVAALRLRKQLDVALPRLQKAYAKVRSNAEVAMSVATAYGMRGELKEMVPYLQDTVRLSTSLEMRQWAHEQLIEVRRVIEEMEKER